MAYSPPNNFSSNTNIQAGELNQNNQALRKYLNKDIQVADYADDSVGTTEVVRGEFYFLTPDHQFTTGDMYTLSKGNESIFRDYFTAQLKLL